MNYQVLEGFRRRLLRRRHWLMSQRRKILGGEQDLLANREADWEEAAAVTSAATVLAGLGERERTALARIQASLDRIQEGTYGACADCGDPIDPARLRAVPDTDRCVGCAGIH